MQFPRVIDPVPPGEESQPRCARRVTLTDRWEPAGESSSVAAEGDEDPFALRLPTLLVANKVECLADADAELRPSWRPPGLAILPSPCRQPRGRASAKSAPGCSAILASPASTPRRRAAHQTGDGRSYSTGARPWRTSHGSCTKPSRVRSGTRASGVQPDSTDSRWGVSIR